jgi:hypothetical protein
MYTNVNHDRPEWKKGKVVTASGTGKKLDSLSLPFALEVQMGILPMWCLKVG